VIKFNECRGMDLISVFPGIVALRVALPFYQILQGFAMPPSPVCMDLFHLVFFCSINQIRGRLCEIRSVCWCFSVGRQETSVKHGMNISLSWEFELHGDWGDDLGDFERSMASWG
jgi:hypothetical protein